MFRNPVFRFRLPTFIQQRVDQHYLDVSLSRVLPLAVLMTFGILVGLVFNTGVGHPYDKVIHIGFYALLTLSIHTLFCCRLRISAVVAFGMGIGGEVMQGFLPHHEMSLADTVANGIGVALIVALIALLRSESRQAVKDEQEDLNFGQMGLEPVRTRYLSGESSDVSGFSSEK
ncbi:MAG: antibiotic resistance protein VanZ [Roseibium sp.]|uniref:antibiotic resistance protein VanZ n=1 Tax=Roseibium sp. TaxID=1936156 RepID=UPI001B1492B9|nr:antibiotic resistance protein VanZ [Roseibium sp.]MBO6894421.1 antibiotic resistance protein VanZ [Roseibium sp.]MBO6929605.1 antibiotic resistance protein VanZ [Roseibium sp.]